MAQIFPSHHRHLFSETLNSRSTGCHREKCRHHRRYRRCSRRRRKGFLIMHLPQRKPSPPSAGLLLETKRDRQWLACGRVVSQPRLTQPPGALIAQLRVAQKLPGGCCWRKIAVAAACVTVAGCADTTAACEGHPVPGICCSQRTSEGSSGGIF